LTAVLDKYSDGLRGLRAIIILIHDEEELQTAKIRPELERLGKISNDLSACLKRLEKGSKSPVRQFAHQLANGSRDERELADIMTELDRAKSSISVRLQLAILGITRKNGDIVLANAAVIHRMDNMLEDFFGKGQGLKLASLLRDRQPQGLSNLFYTLDLANKGR
jgi:hypothetical protein